MNGLELAQRALQLWRQNRGNDSTRNQCQRFDGYYTQWAYQGNDNIVVYGSAKLAADASSMFTTSINDAAIQAGDLLYWHYVDSRRNNYGHVCSVVGRSADGRVLVSNTAAMGDTVQALSHDVKISHADTINLKFRGASHTNGRNLPRAGVTPWPAAALGPQQRQVRPGVQARRRVGAPSTSAPSGDPVLEANTVGNFVGWVTGEKVDGNDLWYVGTSGDYFWSGAFTEVSKHDLADMNKPAPIAGNERQAGGEAVNQRQAATTDSPVVKQIPAGEVGTFDGWKNGQSVNGNAVWFRGATSGLWSWSGGFTDTGTHDLADLNSSTTPEPVTDVIDPVYKTFTKDSALAKWIGSPNYNWRDPRPAGAAPTHITMHWMDGTLAGTDAQFQKYSSVKNGRGDGSASNYGVGQSEIHQYVRERDYQQADGDTNSNRWGLSIEHEGSTSKPVTQAVMDLSAALLVEIAGRWGWTEYVPFTGDTEEFRKKDDAAQLAVITDFAKANPTKRLVFPHKAWASTSCPGTLDWQSIVAAANRGLAPAPEPEPVGIVVTEEFIKAQIAASEASVAAWKSLLS